MKTGESGGVGPQTISCTKTKGGRVSFVGQRKRREVSCAAFYREVEEKREEIDTVSVQGATLLALVVGGEGRRASTCPKEDERFRATKGS